MIEMVPVHLLQEEIVRTDLFKPPKDIFYLLEQKVPETKTAKKNSTAMFKDHTNLEVLTNDMDQPVNSTKQVDDTDTDTLDDLVDLKVFIYLFGLIKLMTRYQLKSANKNLQNKTDGLLKMTRCFTTRR